MATVIGGHEDFVRHIIFCQADEIFGMKVSKKKRETYFHCITYFDVFLTYSFSKYPFAKVEAKTE